jgi:hypothetical protein
VNNWWVPFAGDSAATGIQFHPNYEQKPVWNTGEDFDAYARNRASRRDAAQYVTSDPRPNPQLGDADPGSELRVAGDPRSVFNFSGAHLYSSMPNDTDGVRLNFDFRTVRIDDLIAQAGPENVDSSSTGTSVRDYLRPDTGESLARRDIGPYDRNCSENDVLDVRSVRAEHVSVTADPQKLLIVNTPPTKVDKAHAPDLRAPKTGKLAATVFGFFYGAECVMPLREVFRYVGQRHVGCVLTGFIAAVRLQ